ncbi:hypothetical protein CCR83_11450 [Rhodobacter veldkampii DSM 11550]|uniref:3-methyladenine DNA glycosylase n=1 Tax=Phaeovulum veldkampii DSM 11550 TaxID=1185920 RepID=A0A2T4JL76_9RHOB|nr:cytochrome c [Phaeovulum veldkampii]MBK5947039.1 hypothetical protein [Phaeovulum veldkampii DSM 11550]PTE18655.1 3-methyladenine DNA glycosylase [Phaeovulum veldkampii DSM 11550]TDQ57286.1 cbb3-type cytochrome c oxidase subunit III [Phaeovulum veldkampii DSM 11550]
MTGKFVSLILVAGALAFGPAQADDAGRGLYAQYCSSCHGAEGKGDGPMAEYLTLKSPDLTTLSARNEGKFPMLDVLHIIDGRTGVRAHGGPMPVFGAVFSTEHAATIDYTEVLATRGRILSLAQYIESIQG